MSQNTDYARFLGKGITFPIVLFNGAPEIISGPELIKSSLMSILSWQYGTRYFLAEYGSLLEILLLEPNDFILKQLLRRFVIEAISKWEKRVQVIPENTVIIDVTPYKVNVQIAYIIRGTTSEDSFIFPFYRKITT